ncbi:DNA-binding response regulator [Sphingomonas koreensis]|jgi:two-component system response regulator FixJ|uniref:response regulator transcription factor n=1 Tax=Sphingomonas koreensis TaxID=93064 RepID=UPI000836686B|nr:response regulator [Sphingomonas koreensis]PJI90727.1 two component transcriptional regulator, LuxR family [Sphingomonas koreensis]RSU58537.1 DNA-binding response regulator [Sphingomonas koreensis]RSU66404.1 DNA-binding response regulator [Sphingomonas koreensis]
MTDRLLVHVIDDEESIRRSASFFLKTSGYAVRTWESGVRFLREVDRVENGCILLDIGMPEMDGLEVQQKLNVRGVTMPVIMLTGHGDIAMAVKAMKAGAIDFLEKPFETDALEDAIHRAFERLAAVSRATGRVADAEAVIGVLSEREREVLEGLAQGYPNKTIAYYLGISPRTVEVHRANIMAKLQTRSLSGALRIAFAAGMGEGRA